MLRVPADTTTIVPARRAAGRVQVPGDKSISHRYALLAALADGHSAISGYSPGADCSSTLRCLHALGVRVRQAGDATVSIDGVGVRGLSRPAEPLDAGNSGTTLRLLAGILAAHRFTSTLTGDESLRRRPMRRVMDPLSRMGARLDARDGRPPIVVEGADLHGIDYAPDVPSAQVKSAVLLAGIQAAGRTTVIEPAPTRDHTERALPAFGCAIACAGNTIAVEGGQRLSGRTLRVPGDISSAAFWAALAAGHAGSDLVVEGVGLNPSRTGLIGVLRRAGAEVLVTIDEEAAGEPVGRLHVRHAGARSFSIAPAEVPGVIDEIPALAALAALMPEGTTMEVRGAAELRVKESDRIAALAAGFRALGAGVEEYDDGFTLEARPLSGGAVDSAGDHRLAMAFAIAATGAAAPTTIAGASAVDVSYPGFFEALARLTRAGDDR
jgi:3-phosphoshikimate 1-carboxyvinyltransferase